MADLTGNDIVKLLLPAWRRAMDEGRHRDAVLTAILGYFVLREERTILTIKCRCIGCKRQRS